MKRSKENYEPMIIEVIEINIENGFATSGEGDAPDAPFGGDMFS